MMGACFAFGLPCEVALSPFQDLCPNTCHANDTLNPSHHTRPVTRVWISRAGAKPCIPFYAPWLLGQYSKPLLYEAPRTGGQWMFPPPRKRQLTGQTRLSQVPVLARPHSFIQQVFISTYSVPAKTICIRSWQDQERKIKAKRIAEAREWVCYFISGRWGWPHWWGDIWAQTRSKSECQPRTYLVGEKPRQREQQVQNSWDKSNKKTDLASAVYVREKMGDSIGDGEGDHLWPSLPQ